MATTMLIQRFMKYPKGISSTRFASLIRLEKNPVVALSLFRNPIGDAGAQCKEPFQYTMRHYDIMITKLARAKMLTEMEQILLEVKANSRLSPKESLFCYIINLYARNRKPESAIKLFDEIPEYRCERTIKSFNSLVDGLLTCKEYDKMKNLVMAVDKYGSPDTCTFNILIKWLCKSKRFGDAINLFKDMRRRGITPSNLTFVTLNHGLCLHSSIEEAFELKQFMMEVDQFEPDAQVYLPLIKGLCKSGNLEKAFELKDEMVRKNVSFTPDIYSPLMRGLVKAGRGEEVDEILHEMDKKGCKPANATFNVMIKRACLEENFDLAIKILEEMTEKECPPDDVSFNVILNEFFKKGKWKEAYELFVDMPGRDCPPDVASYRIVFDGLFEAMRFEDALHVLNEMTYRGFRPRSESLDKFLHFLCCRSCDELMFTAVDVLAKAGLLDAKKWRIVLCAVVKSFRNSYDHCSVIDCCR